MPSGSFMSWGEPGPGQWITIYANGGHIYMTVAGLRFDTSGRSERRHALAGRHAARRSGYTVVPPRGSVARDRALRREPAARAPAPARVSFRCALVTLGTVALLAALALAASRRCPPRTGARVALVATGTPRARAARRRLRPRRGADRAARRRARAVAVDGRRPRAASSPRARRSSRSTSTSAREIARRTHGSAHDQRPGDRRPTGAALYAVQGRRLRDPPGAARCACSARSTSAAAARRWRSAATGGSRPSCSTRGRVRDRRSARPAAAAARGGAGRGRRRRSPTAGARSSRARGQPADHLARRPPRAPARRIALPRGAGGNLALSPGRTRLAVGAAPRRAQRRARRPAQRPRAPPGRRRPRPRHAGVDAGRQPALLRQPRQRRR